VSVEGTIVEPVRHRRGTLIPPSPPDQQNYTLWEAAGYLRLCEKSVRNLIKRGLLKGSRGTGKWVFAKKTLDDYMMRTT
jgi:helix-turn-helix protein